MCDLAQDRVATDIMGLKRVPLDTLPHLLLLRIISYPFAQLYPPSAARDAPKQTITNVPRIFYIYHGADDEILGGKESHRAAVQSVN